VPTIQLLGRPAVVASGSSTGPPRGQKTWGLLAYLIRCDTAPTREAVAGLLFPEANDPLRALRWALSEIRRVLGSTNAVRSDPLVLTLPAGTTVDVDVVVHGSWRAALELVQFGRPFLEGVNPAAGAAFELWLENERRYLGAASEGLLHEAALAYLARGNASGAVDLAARLVELNPLDENAQVLHVRCLAANGDRQRARRHVEICTELFRRELGVNPSPALRDAAEAHRQRLGSPSRPAILAQLEAGEAACAAGAVSAGLEALHQAATDAETGSEPGLIARSLVTLGSALVHAARGSDEEGAEVLHRAIDAADRAGEADLSATAHRELGYIEFLRGHYDRADGWLSRAAQLAGRDTEERAWILAVQGAGCTDTGDYPAARTLLDEATRQAQATGATRAEAWVGSFVGRLHLLCHEWDAARTALGRSIDIARRIGWHSLVPFPEALLAEVDLNTGNTERAGESFEHAFAMGCQLGDPCWESLAARGLGLVAAAGGEIDQAVSILDEAPGRCRRLPDSYRWIEAYGMAALAETMVEFGLERARQAITQLEVLASRLGLRELVVTAATLRARLGERAALDTVSTIAAAIDNPALHARVATARSSA
jgi:DNA-binding SARP family transcriptional activator